MDPRRIGATAWLPRERDVLELSRLSPVFDDGAALDDHRISRSALEIATHSHAFELRPSRAGLRFDVEGRAAERGVSLPTAALRRGVRVGLGRGALVHLRLGGPIAARRIPGMVGPSEALAQAVTTVISAARTDSNVLITGESGTGKELAAQALHAHSGRAARPFVAVNAAALSVALGPSQLFGHVRGAFTGADAASPGFFGEANHGTLFLDEIAACPHEVQAQLLRALESGEIQVVGGSTRKVHVRVVAATDADLASACADGRFREPLLHRLARWSVALPPLRTRPEDIAAQAAHFLREGLAERGRPWPLRTEGEPPWLGRGFVEALLAHPWPGNTRELRALVLRCLDEHLERATVPVPVFPSSPSPASAAPLDLAAALAQSDYSLIAAAALLGISRNTLKRRMEAAGLRRPADIGADEIEASIRRSGSVRDASLALQVSERGLRLRMAELGLADGDRRRTGG